MVTTAELLRVCAYYRKVDGSSLHMCIIFFEALRVYFSSANGFFDEGLAMLNTALERKAGVEWSHDTEEIVAHGFDSPIWAAGFYFFEFIASKVQIRQKFVSGDGASS